MTASPKYLSLQELLLTYPIYPYAEASRESLDLLLDYKELDDRLSLFLYRKSYNPDGTRIIRETRITREEHQDFLCTYILLILESESSAESI